MKAKEEKQKRPGSMTLSMLAVVALLVTVVLGIGGTLAIVVNTLNHDENYGYLDAKLVQTWGDKPETAVYPGFTTERTAAAKNVGSEDMYVRIRLDRFWANSETLERETSDAYNTDFIEVGFDDTEKWVLSDDGWYYYSDVIAPGEQSTSLLSSVGISKDVGEERNDGEDTEIVHGGVTSAYLSVTAVVDVELQAVTTVEEPPGPKPEPEPQPEPTPSPDSGGSTNTTPSTSGASGSASNAKQAFITKTGDALPPLAITLFILAGASLLTCIILLLASKRKSKQEE